MRQKWKAYMSFYYEEWALNVKVIENEIAGSHWKARLDLALKIHNNVFAG